MYDIYVISTKGKRRGQGKKGERWWLEIPDVVPKGMGDLKLTETGHPNCCLLISSLLFFSTS